MLVWSLSLLNAYTEICVALFQAESESSIVFCSKYNVYNPVSDTVLILFSPSVFSSAASLSD